MALSLIPSAGVTGVGGLTLVHSATVSSSVSSLNMDNIFTSDYDLYMIQAFNITHAGNAQGNMRVIDSSGSLITASEYQTVRQYVNQAGNTGIMDSNASQSKMIMQYDNDSGRQGSFSGFLSSPLSTSYVKHFYGESGVTDSSNIRFTRFFAGYKTSGTAIRGLNYFSGTNVTAAEFRIYGVAT